MHVGPYGRRTRALGPSSCSGLESNLSERYIFASPSSLVVIMHFAADVRMSSLNPSSSLINRMAAVRASVVTAVAGALGERERERRRIALCQSRSSRVTRVTRSRDYNNLTRIHSTVTCVRERGRVLDEVACGLILPPGRMRSHAATRTPLSPPDRL
jgi:hypothetical protein